MNAVTRAPTRAPAQNRFFPELFRFPSWGPGPLSLKDYDWATVVGTTSYGKGIVQNLIPLGDGSAIKITTAHYYTPSGFDLHGKGIEPDVEVELEEKLKTQAVVKPEEDNQLQKAVQVLKENK